MVHWQGDEGDTFYVLESGEMAAYLAGSGAAIKTYLPGDYFGELALLEGGKRK
jgi:CRP-like cAMP-binding protein